jgi:hypothetical protein
VYHRAVSISGLKWHLGKPSDKFLHSYAHNRQFFYVDIPTVIRFIYMSPRFLSEFITLTPFFFFTILKWTPLLI